MPLPIACWSLGIRTQDGVVTAVDFVEDGTWELSVPTLLASAAQEQLQRYLEDSNWRFTLPISFNGTPFQNRVWAALQKLHPGETRSYGALAHQLGSAARAVGGACGANPIVILVPCHRIVGAHNIGGFSGATAGIQLNIKRWLLQHEQHNADTYQGC